MMVLLHVFDEAIHSLNSLLRGKIYKLNLMIIMGIGVVIALALFSPFILALLNANYNLTMSFFLGIIIAGLGLLLKEINWNTLRPIDLFHFILGVLIVIALDKQAIEVLDIETQPYFLQFMMILIIGIPIALALILPGISTSFMLLSFGAYELVLNAITQFKLGVIIPLLLGIMIGTIILTGFLEKQLRYHRHRLYIIIFGFITGSIVEMLRNMQDFAIQQLPAMLLLFFFGLILMLGIGMLRKQEQV